MKKAAARTQQKVPNRRRGESMIVVIVMLMVFMILGGAVLTASATATATSSARVSERQAYYYARSMLDVLDSSMRTGALGEALCKEMMTRLVAANTESSVRFTEAAPLTLTYMPTLDTALPIDATISDVKVTCAGWATSATAATGNAITKATLQLRKVDVDFHVTYHAQTMKLHVQYRCTGSVENYDTTPKWTMNWVVQQVG